MTHRSAGRRLRDLRADERGGERSTLTTVLLLALLALPLLAVFLWMGRDAGDSLSRGFGDLSTQGLSVGPGGSSGSSGSSGSAGGGSSGGGSGSGSSGAAGGDSASGGGGAGTAPAPTGALEDEGLGPVHWAAFGTLFLAILFASLWFFGARAEGR